MDDPKSVARAVTRALATTAPAAPAKPDNAAAPEGDWFNPSWMAERLAGIDAGFNAANGLFEQVFGEIERLQAKIADLEKKPREVIHERDAAGNVIRSLLVDRDG
jgi:hypothetical protein